MKFEIQLAEKEAEFLEENDCESCSNFSLENKEDLDLLPPLTEQEKIVTWAAGCDKKPLNPTVTEFVPLTIPPKHREHSDIKKENPISIPKELKPLPEQKTTSDKEPVGPGCGGTRAESPNQYEVNTALHNQAVMLKLTMLQAMTPVKFTGNPSDFPTFRDRMRDNLEDGILTDSQRIEFLPKFLGGEAYDVIERVSGCSYKTVVDILEDRYGQPATVAAACIENLTNGPKLPNTDYTGLRDFAEQLESASKKLVGSYELEASTMTNLKQIVRRLPGYLVNKWADTSYAIREKGAAPKLSDLAKFVKRQAAIKNDPGFVNPGFTEYKGKPEKQHENSNTRATSFRPNKQTSSFATYFEMDNTDTDNFHSANRPNTPTPDTRLQMYMLFGHTQTGRVCRISEEDKRAVDILQRTTKMCEGHYETGLLWRKDDLQLPKNKPEAERRMRSLKRKFAREPDLETKYRAVMDGYIAKGHARKLSPEEAAKTGPRTWYLPHFSVTNPNKPGKPRIVFDAAAECEGTSLNKNLLHGPDCTNSLVGVLMRFRQENNTVVADIESMFHQVKVQPDDHDSLRFLWWSESVDEPPEDFVMTVHIFGAADSPCSANSTLKRLADDNQKDFDPITIETLRRNFYVDDILKSVPTPSEAIRLAEQLEELCARGGFNLTKFMSNNRQVLAAIPIEKRAAPTLDLDLDELPTDRALGIQWDVESDTFGFKVTNLNKPDTMRGVLSTISSVFDPLNLAAPAMLPAKQIMQTLWRRKLPWDQPLDGEILEKWKKWKSSLPLLQNFRITRCYFSRLDHEGVRLQLHHFCDASEAAYGTATYLRIEYPDGVIECSFIAGKSRNAPIKSVSIPRLELQGALLAARVDHAIRKELDFKFEKVIFWTDSMITLNYIQNETRRFQTYVANRITEIRELTSPDQWRHCPGKLNPADDVSRGLNMEEFLREERWLNGPTFLTECEDRWPENRFEVITVEDLEVKKEIYLTKLEPAATVDDLINNSSQWVDTLRKIAWLLKFIDWLKSRSVKKKELIENDIQKRIGPDDLERSKRHVAILVQRTVYPEEMRNLKEGKRLKASSEILKLKPIMKEDDVMRVGGRISLAPISPDAANPIILPKKHHITTLLIRHLHESNGHCGVEQLLSLLREQFWVVKARVSIKTVLGKCLHCRKQLAPRMHQGMGELPKVRMIPYEPPFTYSGVDYFGPFYVKRGRGRVIEKRWGAIFTCMNSRAVHLEVAKSLETDDFILVLMRFLNRRGQVKELRSDNGTNFVGAEREIRESIEKMDHDKVERELTHRGCKWVFHPPGAAHMSGVWERLVRIVKRSLKAILGNDPMNEEVLNTVFTEAERIANSRPLTRNPS
ncbi:hypothetical protein QZH41_020147, partial [Actinostola sp. cb2023]